MWPLPPSAVVPSALARGVILNAFVVLLERAKREKTHSHTQTYKKRARLLHFFPLRLAIRITSCFFSPRAARGSPALGESWRVSAALRHAPCLPCVLEEPLPLSCQGAGTHISHTHISSTHMHTPTYTHTPWYTHSGLSLCDVTCFCSSWRLN